VTRALAASLAAALCVVSVALAREETIPRGALVERVAVRADPSHAYAVYLPSGYTPDRKWPILYCFDPVARGAVPVAHFREAAERYGWIVVGSHNSRNGPTSVSLDAAKKMWEDTHARLAIDDRRVYTTGFSGGARVATLLAYGCETCVAGVIAHGAGFPVSYNPVEKKLPLPVRFDYFAAIGRDDFNFPEIVALDRALDPLDVRHTVRRFDGAHVWAPEEVCSEAVEWMELAAMRAGSRAKDAALADAIYASWLGRARALEAADRYEAFLRYEAAAAAFEGLRDTSEAASRAATLRETKEVRSGPKTDADEIKRQAALAGEIASYATARKDQDQRLVAGQEFRRALNALRERSKDERDSPERRVARRALHQVFAWYFETGMMLADQGKPAEAAETLEVAAEVAPRSPEVHYRLAAARAGDGDRKKALDALRRAVEEGFDDGARLRSDPAFQQLRDEPEFRKLLDTIHKDEPDKDG
jgi:predicted esterase